MVVLYALSTAVSLLRPNLPFPWDIDVAGASLILYASGYWLKVRGGEFFESLTRHWGVLLGISLVLIMLSPLGWRIDMKNAVYGIPVLSFLVASLVSLALYVFLRVHPRLGNNAFLLFLGRGSLLIMYIHPVILFLLSPVHLPEGVDAAVAVIGSVIGVYVVQKIPFLEKWLNGRFPSSLSSPAMKPEMGKSA